MFFFSCRVRVDLLTTTCFGMTTVSQPMSCRSWPTSCVTPMCAAHGLCPFQPQPTMHTWWLSVLATTWWRKNMTGESRLYQEKGNKLGRWAVRKVKLWVHSSSVAVVTVKIRNIKNMNAWFLLCDDMQQQYWVLFPWSSSCCCCVEHLYFHCAWFLPSPQLLPCCYCIACHRCHGI